MNSTWKLKVHGVTVVEPILQTKYVTHVEVCIQQCAHNNLFSSAFHILPANFCLKLPKIEKDKTQIVIKKKKKLNK